jgi:hypothetical protein
MKNTIKLFGIAFIALAIVFSTLSLTGCEAPPEETIPPESKPDYISLSEGVWADGSISSGGDGYQWFKFTATADTQYIHFNPVALTNAYVQLYDSSRETTVGTKTSYNSALYTQRTLTNGTAYFIKVTPYNSTANGEYQIAFNKSNTPSVAAKITLPTDQKTTALTANTWADGSISSEGDGYQWFKFTTTAAASYIIHFNSGDLNNAYVQLYDSTGTPVGDRANLSYDGIQNISRALTNNSVYYAKVTLFNSDDSGEYQIAFNTAAIAPAISLPTTENIPVLNEGEWKDSSISLNSEYEQWFKFTATDTTQYIHFNPGTLSSVYVQLYDSTGTTTGNRTNLYSSVLYTSRTLTNDSVYYIRVMPHGGSGAYQIGFNTLSTAPAVSITLPTENITQLTANTWTNGSISSGGEQWFKFTATAANQYIHFNPDTLSSVYVQLYLVDNNTGIPTGIMTNLSTYSTYMSRTLTNNSVYYIKVIPYSSTGNGVYQIGFNVSTTQPPITLPTTNVTSLSENVWADGSIPTAGGEQWFKFTATAANQYIHFNPGTLSGIYVQLYDNTGITAGGRTNLYTTSISTSRTLTNNNEYYIRVTPYTSTASGAYKILFNTSTTPPIILPTENVTTLTQNGWADGSISSSGEREQWFKFTATAATQYIHFKTGTLSNVYVQLYDAFGTGVGTRSYMSSVTTYINRSTTIGNVYYFSVTPGTNTGSGAYQVGFTTSSASPITIPTVANPATPLTENVWANGSLSVNGEQWFKFTATAATQYIHFYPGTLTSGVYVQLYDNTFVETGTRSTLSNTTSYVSRSSLTNDNEYYIRVTYSYYTGTYQIGFTASTTSPVVTLPTANITTLIANEWADGNLSVNGEQWFKFTTTATTQYIHFNPGTLSSVYVQLYTTTGSTAGVRASMDNGTIYLQRTSLTNSSDYYIRVTPSSSTGNGEYQIGFTTSTTSPPITITPPTSNVITLSENVWDNGSISSGGEQWFKFTATATTQYIHFNPKVLTDVYVQLYDSTGTTTGERTNLWSSSSGSNLYTSRSLTNNSVYYIRVTPYSNTGNGAYQIGFNISTTPPPFDLPAVANTTTLTANSWTNGSIPTAGGEQWFKFTATAATQYIFFSTGTLTSVNVQLYDATGTITGARTNLLSTTSNLSRPLTKDSEYYIRVTPYNIYSSGAYQIAFNNLPIPPNTTITTLSENVWTNGSISSGGEQWFKFTATATTQYIHFEKGVLVDVYVQLYTIEGTTTGNRTNLYGSTLSTSRALTNNSEYYIRVTPYSSSGSGAYRLAFNTTSTAPSP